MNCTAVCTHHIISDARLWLSCSWSACPQGYSCPHCALHTVGGLLQIIYPRLLCLLVFRWIQTVGDTVKSPRSKETEKTGNFALLFLSRLGAWQQLLQMPVLARQSCFSSSNSHWVVGSCLLYSLRFSAVVTLWVTS